MNNIKLLTPDIFPQEVFAGITLANKDSFPPHGFSIFPGKILHDDEVENHRHSLADLLNVERKAMIFQKQVHTDGIKLVSFGEPITESDGMLCGEKGTVLNVTVADCCGILIFDPVSKSIAALHSGWKGTSLNIAAKGIAKMQENFGSQPDDLLVWLSPCTGKANYEVEWDVAQHFSNFVSRKSEHKYLLDIREPIKQQLLEAGISESNLRISTDCTIADQRFHSYRRDKELSGRMSAFILIKE